MGQQYRRLTVLTCGQGGPDIRRKLTHLPTGGIVDTRQLNPAGHNGHLVIQRRDVRGLHKGVVMLKSHVKFVIPRYPIAAVI